MKPSTDFPYRLAAIDVDDTLLGPDKAISAENRAAVLRLQSLGCSVVLASGRRHANMTEVCEHLGLRDFAISCQGARVEHVCTREVIHLAEIEPKDSFGVIFQGLDRGLDVVVWQNRGIYVTAITHLVERYRSQTGNDQVSLEAAAVLGAQPAEKIVWLGEPAALARAKTGAEVLFGRRLAFTWAHDWCLEFSAPGASKADGLAALARHRGIPREKVLAFGDGYNDASMLSWAGLGIAMAHGLESARSAARRVSPAGDANTALARAVEEIVGDHAH